MDSEIRLQPFLKWAGGKRWLCSRYAHLIPGTYRRYVEPFVGSGAVFFHLKPQLALISDVNADLIATYRAIRDQWPDVFAALAHHADAHSTEYYYGVRKASPTTRSDVAARFLYLNRTCWNGLYRVNKKGEFNVPRGTKDLVLMPSDNFPETAALLRKSRIECQDFATTLGQCGGGDFVFVDPPYTVAHNLNGFLKYNDKIFTWADQIRLRNNVVQAAARGAAVLVTNADHESVHALYDGIGTKIPLDRATVISGSSSGRKPTTELAIAIGYDPRRAPAPIILEQRRSLPG